MAITGTNISSLPQYRDNYSLRNLDNYSLRNLLTFTAFHVPFFSHLLAVFFSFSFALFSGVYILENTPPPPGGYKLMSFGGKNMERGREKSVQCNTKEGRKRKKEEGERKR
jgi:hypothetical protein